MYMYVSLIRDLKLLSEFLCDIQNDKQFTKRIGVTHIFRHGPAKDETTENLTFL